MNKKKPTRTTSTDSFTSSEVGTLLERIEKDFKVFGEGQSMLANKMDKLETKVGMIYEEVGRQSVDIHILKKDMSVVKADVSEIKETLKGQDKRIERLETLSVK